MPGWPTRAFLGIVAALGSACILVVPDVDGGGAHCAFAGSETACGTCIRERCADRVDPCCSEDACGGVVADVEACATRGDDACARLQSASDRNGAHRELSSCVTSHCADACAPPAKNVTRCKPAYVTSKNACTCDVDGPANDVGCTTAGHPMLRCCAPAGWPGPALACDCLAIICVPIGDGCLCQLSAMDDRGRPTECRGTHCCVDPDGASCRCGNDACVANTTEVAACNVEALRCGNGRREVDACTVVGR